MLQLGVQPLSAKEIYKISRKFHSVPLIEKLHLKFYISDTCGPERVSVARKGETWQGSPKQAPFARFRAREMTGEPDDENPERTAADFKKARPAPELPPKILTAFANTHNDPSEHPRQHKCGFILEDLN